MDGLVALLPNINAVEFVAQNIIKRYQANQWNIANELILMPNSRSARHLEELLTQHQSNMLMPHIKVMSELNEKDLLVFLHNLHP